MKTINPMLTRLVAKAMKPRNLVLQALKNNRQTGPGAHRQSRGPPRRAEQMAGVAPPHQGDTHKGGNGEGMGFLLAGAGAARDRPRPHPQSTPGAR